MTRVYNYGDTTQITEHFKASEFQCKCGNAHDFSVSDELVEKLEQLRSKLNCSAINLSSGFRCIQHDKNVGGSGTGQHTLGNAADISCIGQNGKPISSKLVCCAAQDIGFTGIANINDSYTYTHVDVRSGSKWYGNEIHGNSSVTTDFYQYFGISRDSIAAAKKEDDAMMKGIDVSVHNGTIDWQKVKDTGIDFAILRAGYGRFESQKDTKFEDNYAGAKAVGMPIGAYWYSYATTPDEAKQEAEVCISILNGKQFEYPIFFDLEEKSALNTGKENCSAMVKAFCDALENAGYYAGFYMSRSPLTTHITEEVQKRYALWVAEWNSTLNYSGSVGLWQFSSRGFVNGITGNVDLDVGYVEYPDIIKKKGVNGFPKPVVVEEKAPVFEQAPPASASNSAVTATIQIGEDTYTGTLTKI